MYPTICTNNGVNERQDLMTGMAMTVIIWETNTTIMAPTFENSRDDDRLIETHTNTRADHRWWSPAFLILTAITLWPLGNSR
jgi:hypothetical protein